MKLNLGDGGHLPPGWEGVDRKRGQDAYPLDYPDACADEVRASHLLEHFPHGLTEAVVRDWVRVLKPGGVLKIAVPDFAWVADRYQAGEPINTVGYVMGGQVDGDDYHKALFDAEYLGDLLREAGLEDIGRWDDEIEDCHRLPVSLNLQGRKPAGAAAVSADHVRERARKTGAAMSVPRLGFMDNFFCAFSGLVPLGIGLRKHSGAFWGQCLERCIEEWLADGKEWVLTVDYDTLYTRADVEALLALSIAHPEADAIAPLQSSRTRDTPLMTMRGADGAPLSGPSMMISERVFSPLMTWPIL